MSKRRPPDPAPARPAALGTLGDLLARQGVPSASGEHASPPAAPASPGHDPDIPDLGRSGRVVVRRERKGHGGKTATAIDGLALPARTLEQIARALRRALGCGASVDDDRVVVQGDQADRVQSWLVEHGARRVVRGN